jgi:dTDP-4-dehydrorhamnose reductase
MPDALIGCTGYVGTTLLRQRPFAGLFRSTNVHQVGQGEFDRVVCAGAPAQKWLANKDPLADAQKLETLCAALRQLRCRTFVLISTVDVFKDPREVDESSPVDETGLHAYGLHRRRLEKLVQQEFASHLIVRLPGLVGPGLRKNILFDLHNDNQISAIDDQAAYQFYPMVNLAYDIDRALSAKLQLVHLTAPPLRAATVAEQGFGRKLQAKGAQNSAHYDLHTRYAEAFGGSGPYTYDARASLQAIRTYAQSEPRSRPVSAP